jgi:hypothetical protein
MIIFWCMGEMEKAGGKWFVLKRAKILRQQDSGQVIRRPGTISHDAIVEDQWRPAPTDPWRSNSSEWAPDGLRHKGMPFTSDWRGVGDVTVRKMLVLGRLLICGGPTVDEDRRSTLPL